MNNFTHTQLSFVVLSKVFWGKYYSTWKEHSLPEDLKLDPHKQACHLFPSKRFEIPFLYNCAWQAAACFAFIISVFTSLLCWLCDISVATQIAPLKMNWAIVPSIL